MTDAAHTTYEANEPKDWPGGSPAKVDKALDELAGRSQGGLYDAYDAAGAQVINGSAATVNLDTTRTNTDTDLFVLAADELTLTLVGGGTVDLGYRATIGNSGSDDYGFDVYVEQAPAATGVFAEVTGSRVTGGKGT